MLRTVFSSSKRLAPLAASLVVAAGCLMSANVAALEVTDMRSKLVPPPAAKPERAAPSDEELARRERAAAEAQAVLEDHSFYDAWKGEGRIRTVDEAEEVIKKGELELARIEKAVDDVRLHCYGKFLVNRCIDQAKRLSYDREREVRRVMTRAHDVVRTARNAELKAERAAEAAKPAPEPVTLPKPLLKKPSEPIEFVPRERKAPSEPVRVAPKTPKAPSEPLSIEPKTQKAPSEPLSIEPKTPKAPSEPLATEPKTAEPEPAADERARLESENEAYYNAKQLEAKKRMDEAEATAAKRRAEREAKQKKFEESLKEREAAQQRYEERRKSQDSGLAKFF